jgi:hypothetical protein
MPAKREWRIFCYLGWVVKKAALQRNWLNGDDVSVTRNWLCTGLSTGMGEKRLDVDSVH